MKRKIKALSLFALLAFLSLQPACSTLKTSSNVSTSTSSSSSSSSSDPDIEERTTTADDFTYTTSGNKVTITGIKDTNFTNIVIPDEIDGMPVIYIEGTINGTNSVNFKMLEGGSYNPNIKSIYFGANIAISSQFRTAFFGSNNIEKIEVSKDNPNLYSRNNCLFSKSDNSLVFGIKTSVIPTDIENLTITNFAFVSASFESIHIPSNVKSINETAFAFNRNLLTITCDSPNYEVIDNFLIDKENSAAFAAPSIEYPVIPSSVKQIVSYTFSGRKVKKVTIPANVKLASIPRNGGYTYKMYTFSYSDLEEITFEEGVVFSKTEEVFEDCTKLKQIELPTSCTEISEWAFYNCESLEAIKIPNNATIENGRAFGNNPKLENVYFNSNNTKYAFKDKCIVKKSADSSTSTFDTLVAVLSHEKDFKLPSYIYHKTRYAICATTGIENLDLFNNYDRTVSNNMIYNCTFKTVRVQSAENSTSGTTVGGYSILNCKIDKLIIPKSYSFYTSSTSFRFSASTFCSSGAYMSIINEVEVEEGCNDLESIDGCLVEKATKTLVYYPTGKIVDKITFSDDIKILGYCFNYNKNIKEVVIGKNITEIIGSFNFSSLSKVTFEEGSQLKEINNTAFAYLDNLTEISIPASVTTFGNGVFQYSKNLKVIEINNPETTLYYNDSANNTFYSCYAERINFNGTMAQFKKMFSNDKTKFGNAFTGNLKEIQINDANTATGKRVVAIDDIIW
mgnify:FL=1